MSESKAEIESKIEADLILPPHIVDTIEEAEKNGFNKHTIYIEKMGEIYSASIKGLDSDGMTIITNITTLKIRKAQNGSN